MAPKSRARAAEADDYGSDDGFVEKDDNEQQPKRKKPRLDAKAKKSSKAATATISGGGERDEEGSEFWELSKNRRITISEFKGKRMIHIREYYSKDDKMLPGKKGISLPVKQFSALVRLLPHIEMVLKGHGEDIERPAYDVADVDADAVASTADDTRREPVAEQNVEAGRGKNKRKTKKNFEVTSDEEGSDS